MSKAMMISLLCISSVMLISGCSSNGSTRQTTDTIKVEMHTASGQATSDLSCRLENEFGITNIPHTPYTTPIHRSEKDLHIECTGPDNQTAKGVLISRYDTNFESGSFLGGIVSSAIDYQSGAAFDYPAWVRLVVGKTLYFDRGDDIAGQPNLGRERTQPK